MDIFFIKAGQLIFSLCILVALHEGGHFFFARLFKIRVEKFYLFFNPYFHLFSTKDKWFTRLFPKFKDKETEYGLGWLPLGGYVKISGMIDESMDKEQMQQPVKPWEFRAKPAWQRLLVMIGGVLVNFVLALVLYASILFTWGKDSLPIDHMDMGFAYNQTAQEIGFRNGDVPVSADGTLFTDWNYGEVVRSISEASSVTVLRDGKSVQLTMPEGLDMLQMLKESPAFLAPIKPSVVDSVLSGTPAYEAGMVSGSRILAVDGTSVTTWNQIDSIMSRKNDCLVMGCSAEDSIRIRTVSMVVAAPNKTSTDTLSVFLTADCRMGVVKCSLLDYYELQHKDYGFWESIPAGIKYGINTLTAYVSDLKYLFSAEGAKSVGSFGTIGNLFPATWDWQSFWSITAFLSIMLAFMNILPIPALDGGHVFFLLVEMIIRRQPSDKFMERAQTVGMILLFGLMLLAFYNDIVRFFF